MTENDYGDKHQMMETQTNFSRSYFWKDFKSAKGSYDAENLNVRWLSGAQEEVTREQINIAKCRLRLFDLVMTDELLDTAIQKIVCNLDGWMGPLCAETKLDTTNTSKRKEKSDPLAGIDPILVGAWIERLRPSFEVYDYARILSLRHLRKRGIKDNDLPPYLTDVPSYVETLRRYAPSAAGVGEEKYRFDERLGKMLPPPVNLENESRHTPPINFCKEMKDVWRNNADAVPNVNGLGTILRKQQLAMSVRGAK